MSLPKTLATLDDFGRHLRAQNPFLANRVERMLTTDLVDVPDIHQAEFWRITALARMAHDRNRGIGVTVWGEAGVGKSHLLARLARWAVGQACFVYLHNLQAGPERLPRYLLQCALNVLTGGATSPLARSRLFGLINAAVREALGGEPGASWSEIEIAFRRWIDHAAAKEGTPPERTALGVLLRFFLAAHPRAAGRDEEVAHLAVRWLAGDFLDSAEAVAIGLRPEDAPDGAVGLRDNQHIKQVLIALTRIARSAGQPFLLCFDQADNLDEEQVQALSRFLHDLLDSAGNLLVVTTGVQNTLDSYLRRGVITETSWHRLGEFTIPLGRITPTQGQKLLVARLLRFLAPSLSLPEVAARAGADPLFPLGVMWYRDRLGGQPDVRPRILLTWARDHWQELQEGLRRLPIKDWLERWPAVPQGDLKVPERTVEELIDERVEEKVQEQLALRLRDPDTLPASEDNLTGLVQELLRQCAGQAELYSLTEVRPVTTHAGKKPTYHLLVCQRRGEELLQLGVCFLVAGHGNTATATLRRLAEDANQPDRVLLVTDTRQPLPLGPKGREYLDELEQRGPERFRQVELSFDEYAALDALQAAVGMARSGDLEVEHPRGRVQPVSPAEVIASHHRRQRYLRHRLLRQLLTSAPTSQPLDALPGR